MKFCEICSCEIFTKDGDNRCNKCQDVTRVPAKVKRQRINRDQIMRDLGLTKVKGALGGTYWE